MITIAGPVADHLITETSDLPGSWSDECANVLEYVLSEIPQHYQRLIWGHRLLRMVCGLIVKHRIEIEAVARALVAHKAITGRQIEDLVAAIERSREGANMKMTIDRLAEKITELISRMLMVEAYMCCSERCCDGRRRWLSEEELKPLINCDA